MSRRSKPQNKRVRAKDIDVGSLPKISETLIAFAQPQLRESFPYDSAPSYLVLDRDSIFSQRVKTLFVN